MEREQAEAVIEAILFTMGNSVEVSRIANVIEESVEKTREIIRGMAERMKTENRGVEIIELDSAFQMCTRSDMYDYLLKIAKAPRKLVLSDSALETLSIIAYKQPITRAEIERIRGVNSDHAVNRLVEYDLIEEVGRKDAPGHPILFGTTEQFLRSFGVASLEDLPSLNPEQIEDFRLQAEMEVEESLNESVNVEV